MNGSKNQSKGKGPKAGGRRQGARAAAIAKQKRERLIVGGAIAAVVVLAAAIGIVIAMAGSSDDASRSANAIDLIAGDNFYEALDAPVDAGDVTITVKNGGRITHELTIIEPGTRIDARSQFDPETSAGNIRAIARDDEVTQTFNLTPGTYQLVCLIPGHLEAGMTTDLVVE